MAVGRHTARAQATRRAARVSRPRQRAGRHGSPAAAAGRVSPARRRRRRRRRRGVVLTVGSGGGGTRQRGHGPPTGGWRWSREDDRRAEHEMKGSGAVARARRGGASNTTHLNARAWRGRPPPHEACTRLRTRQTGAREGRPARRQAPYWRKVGLERPPQTTRVPAVTYGRRGRDTAASAAVDAPDAVGATSTPRGPPPPPPRRRMTS